tara:strand:- start:442 stop:1908 length:1467 start_codon:yes stop_codon:yes gene_type:complete
MKKLLLLTLFTFGFIYADCSDGDYDNDLNCDITDTDDDNDGIEDEFDSCPQGELGWESNETTDYDSDGCLDSSSEDLDDDNDGALDDFDIDDNNIFVCSDNDYDGCEDCLSGSYDPSNDGPDNDGDGQCDLGDINIELHAGTNLISFYALPEDGNYSLANIFGDLGDNAIIMYTQGATGLNIGNSTWVGSLADVSEHRGYWLIVGESDNLQIHGIPTAPVFYDITIGHNLISYPYDYRHQSLSDALNDNTINSISAIYGEGVATIRIDNAWEGSLESFEGGKGYWIYANNDFQFEFNQPNVGDFSPNPLPNPPEIFSFNQSMYQYFYFINDVENLLVDGDWIVAYCNDVVVGSRQYNTENNIIDLPIMGYHYEESVELPELTTNYCQLGDIPLIKIHNSSGQIYEPVLNAEFGSLSFNEIGHAIVNLYSDNALIGDINEDGAINVVDIVNLVNWILGDFPYSIVADINEDGQINVVDIVNLVNLILNP